MDNKCVEKLLETVAFSNGCICSVELIRWEHTHFHPFGNLFPSKEDCGMTDRLLRLSELLGIPIVDHIIVGGDNREYFSFREHCLIENPVIKYASCCEDISVDRFGKVENLEEKTKSCGEEKRKL